MISELYFTRLDICKQSESEEKGHLLMTNVARAPVFGKHILHNRVKDIGRECIARGSVVVKTNIFFTRGDVCCARLIGAIP